MTTDLHGARILVTRPAAQAGKLCQLIEAANGVAHRFPTLAIEAVAPSPETLAAAATGDWLIFTSTNAVDFAIQAFDGKMPKSERLKIAAVGAATAQALRQTGCAVNCVPESEFSSEGLLAETPMQHLAGLRCSIVRGVGGREKLAEGLRERQADVTYLEVYRRRRPNADSAELAGCLRERRVGAVTITSTEALQNLLDMVDEASANLLKTVPLVVVSDRIRQTAETLGFEQIAVSRQPTDAAILETLTTLFNGENSGRSN